MALINRKCICDLCSCGRHHCPHPPTKIYEKTEKPCLFTEYTEKYPTYHSYAPRESFKPKLEYQKGTIPMEGLSTTKRDFGIHSMVPVKHYRPDKFTPSQDEMDFLTTYNQHYNYYPASRVSPIKPRDNKHPCTDKLESMPTYKSDYLPWNQQRRPSFRPQQTYRPSSCRFDHRTTHQDDYPLKNLVDTVSYKPPPGPKLCNIPLENMTSYKASYVAHPVEKRYVYEAEKYKPCEIPFDGLTTQKDSYKGLMGEPAKSWKPMSKHSGLDTPFPNNTEFRDKFQAWPTPQIVPKEPVPYIPPEGKMDLLTTVQSDYTCTNGVPAQSCRPVYHIKKSERFEGSTTNRDDYKHWANVRREPVKPAPQLKFSDEPMDYMTTNRAHYVAHTPANTISCKPTWSGPRANIPVEGQTTYSTSFTPKEIQRCPASYSEPPGYIFEEVDALGHRLYRPASHTASQQSNHLGFGDAESPSQIELAIPTCP
ncbi:stabilizer of axonemal microtubules 1 [Phodopus roborovskii]|uniref:Saxol1 protein n=1 Tax=Phodopus roborovskii TaxID=109678 RepID=A0AAV0AG55_PHORO|nr:stabilizer of axonemal microtubules 1 [Phodopus roborovskii]CAH7478463.1 Saxol1 [Phodopus roborovskii]